MLEVVFDALSGDQMARQHLLWLAGKPAFWLVVAKWSVLFLGVILISARLVASKQLAWLVFFLLVVYGGVCGIYELSQQAAQSFREGHSRGTGLLRLIGFLMDAMALFVVVWITRRIINLKK